MKYLTFEIMSYKEDDYRRIFGGNNKEEIEGVISTIIEDKKDHSNGILFFYLFLKEASSPYLISAINVSNEKRLLFDLIDKSHINLSTIDQAAGYINKISSHEFRPYSYKPLILDYLLNYCVNHEEYVPLDRVIEKVTEKKVKKYIQSKIKKDIKVKNPFEHLLI